MQMNSYAPGTPEWFSQVHEEVIDPARRIVDPHHHLWPIGGALPYGLDQLHGDTTAGHLIEKTVSKNNPIKQQEFMYSCNFILNAIGGISIYISRRAPS